MRDSPDFPCLAARIQTRPDRRRDSEMLILSALSGAGLFGRPAEHPWLQYLMGAARGEQSAFARLYDESSGLVYSVVLKILGNPADAEEVVLDVYMQVWRRAGDY